MKTSLCILIPTVILIGVLVSNCNQSPNSYVIQKRNGKVILAYKAFDDFLNSDRSWKSYKSILLDAYPSMQKVHNRQIEWGSLDTAKFRDEIKNYKKEDFEKYLSQYSLKTINYLYDSVIAMSQEILPTVSNKAVDLCFMLPYEGCFIIPEESLNTIFISMYIDPAEAEKIMVHEYAHLLHIDRRPDEPLSLKREIISEGMAVFLTNRVIKNIAVSNSIPFMPPDEFEWCLKNEQLIKDSIKLELQDTTMRLFKRYIADGGFATPPAGFVQKTGFFTGYRIIEKCVNMGIPIEDLCSFNSETVIDKSGYFK